MNYLRLLLILPFYILVSPSVALAEGTPDPRSGLVLDPTQTYTLLIGALVPLVTYLLNHYAPWCDEKVKGIVHVITAAVAGGLYQALSGGELGFNAPTVQILGTSVIAALFAHRILWQPSGISTALGGGQNSTASQPNSQ